MIEAAVAQGPDDRGPEIRQPPGLGVDSLHAGGERGGPVHHRTAADVDVEVKAVLDDLSCEPTRGVLQLLDARAWANPRSRSLTRGLIQARSRASAQPR